MMRFFRRTAPRRYFNLTDFSVDVRRGTWIPEFLQDPYHYFLKISWTKFFVFLFGFFILINTIAAVLLSLDPSSEPLGNLTREKIFLQEFFFSVQTTMTIGYGFLYPKTMYANVVVTGISFLSFCFTAMSTGLVFARFSVPQSRVIYSRHVTIAEGRDGYKELRFRLTTARSNSILEGSLNVAVLKLEIEPNGSRMRRLFDLKLDRSNMPLIGLLWLVTHKIDESSPLWGMSIEEMKRDGLAIFLTLSGVDATSFQTLYSRYIYSAKDFAENHVFVDVVHDDGNRRWVELNDFHKIHALS